MSWCIVFHQGQPVVGIDLIKKRNQILLVNVLNKVNGFTLARGDDNKRLLLIAIEAPPHHRGHASAFEGQDEILGGVF